MTRISKFRASIIWVETIPSILAGTLPGDAKYSFLGQAETYAKCFDDCRKGAPGPDGLELPWNRPGNYYWKHYLERTEAMDATGAQAWKKFVPFRRSLPCKTIDKDPAAKVSFEAFYAPQGIAVIAKMDYDGAFSTMLEIAKLALKVRYDYRFEIAGSPPGGLSLDHAAEAALEFARRQGFGEVAYAPGHNQPFSISSFIVGEVDDAAAPMKDASDEHRALEAVTSWNPYFEKVNLSTVPLVDAKLPMHSLLDSDLMYGHKTGRAIWLPRAFTQKTRTRKISCYHRNITIASLQTLSLGEFVSWVAARHANQEPIAAILDQRGKRAADVLQLMSDGKLSTYRTASVADQVKKANWSSDIASVRSLP